MNWNFRQIGPPYVGSTLAEFFNTDAIREFTDALIREDVQNRLDARRLDVPADKPVRIRYFLSEGRDGGQRKIKRWLSEIEPHCNAPACCNAYCREQLHCFYSSALRYLTIECFNTTGLKGDPAVVTENDPDILENDFYWMMRNVGRSGKKRQKGKRGSWGIGKVVYQLASRINTIFCYSISKNGFSLIGQTQLEPHEMKGEMYSAFGYFADHANPDIPMPLQDVTSQLARDFKADFGISRADDEMGTSTVIPFCREDVTFKALAVSAIRSYLWEILKGHVVIEIQNDCGDAICLENNPKALINYIERYVDGEDERLKYEVFCGFYSRIIKNQKTPGEFNRYVLKEPTNYRLLSDVRPFFDSPEVFLKAQREYLDEKIVEIDAIVTIEKTDGTSWPATFQVFLSRKYAFEPIISFIRDGLTILKLKYHRQGAFCGLTLIEPTAEGVENPLSDFVRAAESPSHTELNPARDAFKGNYTRGSKMLLEYITDLVWKLAAAFSDLDGKEDESALDDWFPYDDTSADGDAPDVPEGNEGAATQKKRKKRKKIKSVVPPLPRKKTFFRVADWNQGVKIVASETPAKQEDLPWNLQLKLAYTAEGVAAPLKKYDLSDFDCRDGGTINFNLVGAEPIKREPNRVVLKVTQPEFSVELTGFGENRCDIYVEAQKIKTADVEDGTPDENTARNDLEGDVEEVSEEEVGE